MTGRGAPLLRALVTVAALAPGILAVALVIWDVRRAWVLEAAKSERLRRLEPLQAIAAKAAELDRRKADLTRQIGFIENEKKRQVGTSMRLVPALSRLPDDFDITHVRLDVATGALVADGRYDGDVDKLESLVAAAIGPAHVTSDAAARTVRIQVNVSDVPPAKGSER